MRVALIDCGTNTFHLVVAESGNRGRPALLHAETAPVKLGESLFTTGMLSSDAIDRGVDVFSRFVSALNAYRPDRVLAYGTAALRHARNAGVFLDKVHRASGILPVVIDGAAEARLIGYGVMQSLPALDGPVLIMDIGGGSTEFIACRGQDILISESFPLGGALLRQRYASSDPCAPGEVARIEAHAGALLAGLFATIRERGGIGHLVGSAGSFDTFRSLAAWMSSGKDAPAGAATADIDLPVFERLHRALLRSTQAERLAMPGMAAFRADTIVVASILVTFVLHRLHMQRLTWSSHSLKEGMLYAVLHDNDILKPGSPYA